MSTFVKLATVQTKLYMREPMAVFFTLILGPMVLVMMGLIFGNAPQAQLGGLSQLDISVPCFTVLVFSITALTTVPVLVVTRRETGVLRRFSATPLKPLMYFISDILAPFLVAMAGIIFLALLGFLVYHVHFQGQWLSFAAGVILSTLSFFALGYALAGVIPSLRAAIVVGNALIIPMNMLSGAMIPLEVLPEGVRNIARFIPQTYAVSLLRGLWYGDAWQAHLTDIAVLGGLFILGLVVVALTFRWE